MTAVVSIGTHRELKDRYDQTLNQLWALVYPNEPGAWEYPAQVVREVEMAFGALQADVNGLKAERETLRGAF